MREKEGERKRGSKATNNMFQIDTQNDRYNNHHYVVSHKNTTPKLNYYSKRCFGRKRGGQKESVKYIHGGGDRIQA